MCLQYLVFQIENVCERSKSADLLVGGSEDGHRGRGGSRGPGTSTSGRPAMISDLRLGRHIDQGKTCQDKSTRISILKFFYLIKKKLFRFFFFILLGSIINYA